MADCSKCTAIDNCQVCSNGVVFDTVNKKCSSVAISTTAYFPFLIGAAVFGALIVGSKCIEPTSDPVTAAVGVTGLAEVSCLLTVVIYTKVNYQ